MRDCKPALSCCFAGPSAAPELPADQPNLVSPRRRHRYTSAGIHRVALPYPRRIWLMIPISAVTWLIINGMHTYKQDTRMGRSVRKRRRRCRPPPASSSARRPRRALVSASVAVACTDETYVAGRAGFRLALRRGDVYT